MTDFLEQMNSSQFKEIETFFETMPKLSHTVKVKNPKTKRKVKSYLRGLASFRVAMVHMNLENYQSKLS